jgi:hypothetical protein
MAVDDEKQSLQNEHETSSSGHIVSKKKHFTRKEQE